MGFRNPILTVTADQVTAGAFGSVYSIAGRFTVGDPAHAHVVLGTDAAGADGVRLYAADGVTVLVDLRADTGAATFKGAVQVGSSVPGSTVTGSVANATNAAAATSATNLAGGGTASGSTTIAGELIVGNPAAAHAVIGTDGAGADGFRLYASDGATVLIDLNIAGTPTITAADIRTAASGQRVEMSSATADRVDFISGTETNPANLRGAENASLQPGMLGMFSQDNGGGTVAGVSVDPSGIVRIGSGSWDAYLRQSAVSGDVHVRATNIFLESDNASVNDLTNNEGHAIPYGALHNFSTIPPNSSPSATTTAAVGPFTAATTILSGTWHLIAGRLYRLTSTWFGTAFTVASDLAEFDFGVTGVTVAWRSASARYMAGSRVGNNDGITFTALLLAQSSGTATISVVGQRIAGTGTITVDANGGNPAALWVEDVGAD